MQGTMSLFSSYLINSETFLDILKERICATRWIFHKHLLLFEDTHFFLSVIKGFSVQFLISSFQMSANVDTFLKSGSSIMSPTSNESVSRFVIIIT